MVFRVIEWTQFVVEDRKWDRWIMKECVSPPKLRRGSGAGDIII